MSLIGRLTSYFTRAGRDHNLLQLGIGYAKAKRPEKAIIAYDALVQGKSTSSAIRAQALFNRALAYSSMKEDDKAISDLEQVVTMAAAPENVLTAARTQLVRVRNRVQR